MRLLKDKLRLKKDVAHLIAEIIAIHPAGQCGRNYSEYTMIFDGQKIRMKDSVIHTIFETPKFETPKAPEPIKEEVKEEPIKRLKRGVRKNAKK